MTLLKWISDNIEIVALFLSFLSIAFAVIFSILQQQYNKKSVIPICSIIFNDYENLISIRLDNNGVGPLIINKLIVVYNSKEYPTLIELMPKNILWNNFVENIESRAIRPNGKIELLKLTSGDRSKKIKVRKILSQLVIHVEYKDIYGKQFIAERDLKFFARTLPDKKMQMNDKFHPGKEPPYD
jgi:hypothetical protein